MIENEKEKEKKKGTLFENELLEDDDHCYG